MKKILIFLLVIGFIATGCGKNTAIEVSVYNQSGEEIRNVTLIYTGGRVNSDLIRPGEMSILRVNPTGASDIQIQFSSKGQHVEQKLDVYFENNYSGYLAINITKDNKITYEDKTSIS